MFKKFISYYKPYKKIFILDMICAFGEAIADLSFPLLTAYMVNVVFTSNDKAFLASEAKRVVIVLFALLVFRMICTYYVNYIGHVMGMRMETDMRRDLFTKMSNLSFSFYDNNNTGQMISRLTSDLFDVTELAHHGPENIFISIVKIVGALIILARVNVTLTLSIFVMVIIIGIFSKHYNVKMKNDLKQSREKVGNINESALDSLSGIRVVKSFANEKNENKKFQKGNTEFLNAKGAFYKTMGIYTSVNGFLQDNIYILVFVLGTIFIYNGNMDSSNMILFVLYIGMFLQPMKTIINFTEMYQKGFTGFRRMQEIMDEEIETVEKENPVRFDTLKGDIEFKNVSFKYKDTDEYVLENINVKIPKNKSIAIVGSSGGGKSTFCSLIPRFYDVTEGSVLIDGINVADMSIKDLRRNIGVVQQDVYIFGTSIKDNIAYGVPNATDEEIIEAAKRANIHDFIMTLEYGYDTFLGERGVRFSGGQKQRISIARVFLKNPPILILDEATAALDNESERYIQKSLEELSKDRTTIVIAHRLSTIRNSDEIYVLTEDGIVESGSHDELIIKDGKYKTLYDLQFEIL